MTRYILSMLVFVSLLSACTQSSPATELGQISTTATILDQLVEQAIPEATLQPKKAAPGTPRGKLPGPNAGQVAPPDVKPTPPREPAKAPNEQGQKFNIEQALSPEAQRKTIAFSALGFLTGDFNADTFFPPGKVADFWGFQYLRDNDLSGMGHNTDFLTYAALNMLSILTVDQRAELTALAESQVDKINEYALKRFILIDAFRRNLNGEYPAGTSELDIEAVQEYSAEIYRLDGEITLERAHVMSKIINELTIEQRASLDSMVGVGMSEWDRPEEPSDLRGLERDVKVAVMTYAGDLFSWYGGSVEADTYINPERQGTYFGAFYLKDAPAVGNPGYIISSRLTADMGEAFLEVLDENQQSLVEEILSLEHPYLLEIVDIRQSIATELRRSLAGESLDDEEIQNLMQDYGRADGALVYYFARNFAQLHAGLSAEQIDKLMDLRTQMLGNLVPEKPFLYSQAIDMPELPASDFLFK
jgi:hypothetical protein